jgi:hypothetical protein
MRKRYSQGNCIDALVLSLFLRERIAEVRARGNPSTQPSPLWQFQTSDLALS